MLRPPYGGLSHTFNDKDDAMAEVRLTTIKSQAGNKIVKPDADGYYKVVLGAFNTTNSSGDIYSYSGIPEIFADKSNVMNQRLLTGRLRAEADHPVRAPGETVNSFVRRNMDISTKSTAGHIKEVNLVATDVTENIPGMGKVVLVTGLVKPSGVFGKGLKDSLDNPEEDTCFSVRCFSIPKPNGLRTIRYVKQIVTWDWVNAPGIKHASKLNGPTVESEDLAIFDIATLIEEMQSDPEYCTAESSELLDAAMELNVPVPEGDIISRW